MKPDDISREAWHHALALLNRDEIKPSSVEPVARAIDEAVKREREALMDAANEYMKVQYGIGALGHPVDRERIAAIRARGEG